MDLSNILKIPPIKLNKVFFRMVRDFYSEDILGTGESREFGGRYNENGIGALYLGENEDVCKAEIKRKDPLFLSKYVIREIKVELDGVLDISDEKNLKILGISKKDLVKNEEKGGYKITRAISNEAHKKGYKALLVPSVSGKGNYLVIFISNLEKLELKSLDY